MAQELQKGVIIWGFDFSDALKIPAFAEMTVSDECDTVMTTM